MSWIDQGRQRHGWFGHGTASHMGPPTRRWTGQGSPASRIVRVATGGAPIPEMGPPYVATDLEHWKRRAPDGRGQRVDLVKLATGAPQTSGWRAGDWVRGNTELALGTAIATFGPDGRYGNRTDGTSHAAIYLGQGPEGLRILDQYTGADGIVRKQGRILRWEGGNPSSQSVDEGKNYRVIR